MKQKINYTELLKEIVILTGAMAVISAAVYFFLVPSKTSVSSISGLGIILSNFVQLPLSTITMIMNVMLLIIGFLTCGKEFGVKTIYTSIMLPVFLPQSDSGGLFPEFLHSFPIFSAFQLIFQSSILLKNQEIPTE